MINLVFIIYSLLNGFDSDDEECKKFKHLIRQIVSSADPSLRNIQILLEFYNIEFLYQKFKQITPYYNEYSI
jgi:hypothetical protein